jgi:hypothetical protein
MKSLVLLFSLLVLPKAFAVRATDLVDDAQKLYDGLPNQDSQKINVGLRLADLLFESSVEIFSEGQVNAKKMARVDSFRNRSKQLYESALPKLRGASALRVKFQLSRLYSDLGQINRAITLWQELANQKEDLMICRESALRLAEQFESSNTPEKIRSAQRLYAMAYPLTDRQNIRAYIQYRIAWTQYRASESLRAIETLQKALAMSDPGTREEMVKDMVLFLAHSPKPATESLKLVKDLERENKRQGLVAALGEAYLASDKKEEYATVLTDLNKKNPTLDRSVSLLDSRHDVMSTDELLESLKNLTKAKKSGVGFLDAASEKRAGDIYHRLLLFWDGQRRAGRQGSAPVFDLAVDTSLQLFPEREETSKAVSGWLAATPDAKLRLAKMDLWIENSAHSKNGKLTLLLHKTRLELARELKLWPVVLQEASLVEANGSNQDKRAGKYQHAKALYELKKFDEALPLFLTIADESLKPQDDLIRFSQDLVLEIYAQQKNYAPVVENIARWAPRSPRAAELIAISDKARFELAANQKNAASLREFSQFCFAKKFLPKSCENARSLAVELQDRPALIALLKVQGDETELIHQYEIGGAFSESAKLLEKHLKMTDLLGTLKVAMLYELDGALKERDRILNGLAKHLSTAKTSLSGDEQSLLYTTLMDANLISASSLNLPFDKKIKLEIADKLYLSQKSPLAQKMLLAECTSAGTGWNLAHLKYLQNLYELERKIAFVGSRGRAKFLKRVDALKEFASDADCYHKGAVGGDRVSIAAKVSQAYSEFVEQIHSAPIPEGLDDATKAQVLEQIAKTGEPFSETATGWLKAAQADVEKADEPSRVGLAAQLEDKDWNFSAGSMIDSETKSQSLVFDWKSELNELRQNPYQRASLEKLKLHFEQKGTSRLAAYMDGRLQGLEKQ